MDSLNVMTYAHEAVVIPVDISKRKTSEVLLDVCKASGSDDFTSDNISEINDLSGGELLCAKVRDKFVILMHYHGRNKDVALEHVKECTSRLVALTSDLKFKSLFYPFSISKKFDDHEHYNLRNFYYKNASKYVH